MPPDTLRDLVTEAIALSWDTSAFDAVMGIEERDKVALRA